MARRAYVPSGKADPGALPRIAILCFLSAVLGGLFFGFVSQWLSLLIVFPALLGALVGGVALSQVKAKHVRMPLAVALITLACGVAAESVNHLMKYVNARSAIAHELEGDVTAAPFIAEHGLAATVDAVLSGDEHQPVLLGYFDMAAKAGITITRAGHSSSSNPTLTGVGVYALWFINFLIVCGVAMAMGVSEARKPFCEGCVAWYDSTFPIANGAGDKGTMKQAVLRLDGAQYAEAARNLGTTNGKSASVLTLVGCSKCNAHDPVIELTQITGIKANKQQLKKVFVSLISPSEAASLREALKPTVAT